MPAITQGVGTMQKPYEKWGKILKPYQLVLACPICEKNNMNKYNLSKLLQFYHPSGRRIPLGIFLSVSSIFEAFPNTSPISPGEATIGLENPTY